MTADLLTLNDFLILSEVANSQRCVFNLLRNAFKVYLVFYLQVTRFTESMHVFYLQSSIHQQFNRDSGVLNSAWDSTGITYGGQFLRLLTNC